MKDYSYAPYVAPNTIGSDPLSVAHIRVPMTFKMVIILYLDIKNLLKICFIKKENEE